MADEPNEAKTQAGNDILRALLDQTHTPEAEVEIKRLGVTFRVRGLRDKEVRKIREQAEYTYKDRRTGRRMSDVDWDEYTSLMIITGTVGFDWGNRELMAKFKANSPEEVVSQVLLAGEKDKLANAIMDLSGFEDVEEIKN
jgi:hypothetical protein